MREHVEINKDGEYVQDDGRCKMNVKLNIASNGEFLPGVQIRPSDKENVWFYLKNKVQAHLLSGEAYVEDSRAREHEDPTRGKWFCKSSHCFLYEIR